MLGEAPIAEDKTQAGFPKFDVALAKDGVTPEQGRDGGDEEDDASRSRLPDKILSQQPYANAQRFLDQFQQGFQIPGTVVPFTV